MLTISFVSVLLLFLFVGLSSISKKKATAQDYLLADRAIGPWAIGLSAVATGQSGFKFIGLIGYTYLTGVSSIWIIIGWFLGDLIAWKSGVPERLRKKSEEEGSLTITTYLSQHKGKISKSISIAVGLVIFIFLSSYAAAQLASAGKSLQALLKWEYNTGAYLSAVMIFLYCFAGGIRASIWTDTIQAIVMLIGMYSLVWMSIKEAGGFFHIFDSLSSIDPSLGVFFPNSYLAFLLLFISFVVSGFGVLGQPHVMVRSMAVDSVKHMAHVRKIYLYLGYSMSLGSYLIGLAARIIIPLKEKIDAEMIMPYLAEQMFHPIFAGFLLAALLASTISTADSQILVCSSAFLSKDFMKKNDNYLILKLLTLFTIVFTLFIALNSTHVFTLVMFSWSVLASSLTALLIIKSFFARPPEIVCLLMVVFGAVTAITWRLLGLQSIVYESFPGIVLSILPYLLWKVFSFPDNRVEAEQLLKVNNKA